MKKPIGSLFVITGESAAGKSRLVAEAIAKGVGVRVITCTTRLPRANKGVMEVDGVDYRFLSTDEFALRLANNEFAEHATVHGKHSYGTLKQDIEHARVHSSVILIIVDIQGAETLMHIYPEAHALFIHVKKSEMRTRLVERGGDDADAITRRLAEYDREWARAHLCHEVIVNANGKFEATMKQFISIIELRRSAELCMNAYRVRKKQLKTP